MNKTIKQETTKSIRKVLSRYERLCSLSILLLNSVGEVLDEEDDGTMQYDFQTYLKRARPLPVADVQGIETLEPAIKGLLAYQSEEYGTNVFFPVQLDALSSGFIVVFDFRLVDEQQSTPASMVNTGFHLYTATYIVNLFTVLRACVVDSTECISLKRTTQEKITSDRKTVIEFQLLMRLWKAGRWYYTIETQQNSIDENCKEIYGVPDSTDIENFTDYFEEHVFPEDRERINVIMGEYLSGKTDIYHVLFHFHSETKGIIWIEGIGAVGEYSADGKPQTIIGLNRDITEYEKRQQDLFKTNNVLFSLLENMPSGVFWKDLNSVYLGANDVFAHNVGLSSSIEVIGKTDKELPYVSEDFEHFREQDMEVIHTKKPVFDEIYSLHREDGRPGWSYTNKVPLIDDEGEVIGLLGVYTDISKLKWTELQLLDRERNLQAILNCSSDIIMIVESDFTIEYISPAVEQILGYTTDELLHTSIHKLMVDEAYEEFIERMNQRIKDASYSDKEQVSSPIAKMHASIDMRTRDSTILTMDMILTPLIDGGSALTRYLGVFRDITEQRRLQEELRQSQKIEAIGRLAGGVAHDFNNLLQVILGYSELLGDTISKDTYGSAMLSSIIDAATRAGILVDQLLKFSQNEQFVLEKLDLGRCIDQLIPYLTDFVSDRVTITLKKKDGLPPIYADAYRVKQICINLCMNADEAMPEGGAIDIVIDEIVYDSPVSVYGESMPSGRYIYLEFNDTGVGIDKEQLDMLFEPFYTTKELAQGVGLGLAMVYGIVKEHKGYIKVSSSVNERTRFTIYFPVESDI